VEQVRKGRRADAWAALAKVQQEQERHRSEHPSYAEGLDALPVAASSPAGHYRLQLSAVSPQGYTLTAQPVRGGAQEGDQRCAEFRLVLLRGDARLSARHADGQDSSAACLPR
jgi:type IV pilus assembly protein PilE